MHGTINIKYIEAKQARAIYHFKNTKRKLYRTNAAIWYNKTCKLKRLTPDYINIKINGKKPQVPEDNRYGHPVSPQPRNQIPLHQEIKTQRTTVCAT